MSQLLYILCITVLSLQSTYTTEQEKFFPSTEARKGLEVEIADYTKILDELNEQGAPTTLKETFFKLKASYEELLKEYNLNQNISIEKRMSEIQRNHNPLYNNAATFH